MAKSDNVVDLATYKAISKSKLESVLKSVRASQNVITEETSSIGGTIADAVENHRLHKKAFSVIRMLDKMARKKDGNGEAAVTEFLFHFDAMVDMLGFREMKGLPVGDRDGDEDEEDEYEEGDEDEESDPPQLHA